MFKTQSPRGGGGSQLMFLLPKHPAMFLLHKTPAALVLGYQQSSMYVFRLVTVGK